MSYVIYNLKSTKIRGDRTYKTHAAAQAALTRINNTWNRDYPAELDQPRFLFGIAELDHYYKNIERQVERVNLMSGKTYTESVNTPLSCSPASETYWSM